MKKKNAKEIEMESYSPLRNWGNREGEVRETGRVMSIDFSQIHFAILGVCACTCVRVRVCVSLD